MGEIVLYGDSGAAGQGDGQIRTLGREGDVALGDPCAEAQDIVVGQHAAIAPPDDVVAVAAIVPVGVVAAAAGQLIVAATADQRFAESGSVESFAARGADDGRNAVSRNDIELEGRRADRAAAVRGRNRDGQDVDIVHVGRPAEAGTVEGQPGGQSAAVRQSRRQRDPVIDVDVDERGGRDDEVEGSTHGALEARQRIARDRRVIGVGHRQREGGRRRLAEAIAGDDFDDVVADIPIQREAGQGSTIEGQPVGQWLARCLTRRVSQDISVIDVAESRRRDGVGEHAVLVGRHIRQTIHDLRCNIH